MRLRLLAAALVTFALAAPAVAAPPFRATLKAGTHTPAINVKWFWELKVADLQGRPLRATLTLQIIDPFGGVHPVEFGNSKRAIVNFAFRGRIRDFIRFPPESKGFRLTLRWTVKAKGAKRVLTYWVKSR